jgi:hypothetical protein
MPQNSVRAGFSPTEKARRSLGFRALSFFAYLDAASTGQTLAQIPQSRHFSSSILNFPISLITTAPNGHSTSQVPQLMHLD